jgi:hypothetical protein
VTRNPNSLLTRIRFRLAQWITPLPAAGEGWCIGCALNQGRTLVLSPDNVRAHAQKHEDTGGEARNMHVVTAQRARPGQEP